jgi:hypothetical protein
MMNFSLLSMKDLCILKGTEIHSLVAMISVKIDANYCWLRHGQNQSILNFMLAYISPTDCVNRILIKINKERGNLGESFVCSFNVNICKLFSYFSYSVISICKDVQILFSYIFPIIGVNCLEYIFVPFFCYVLYYY